MITIIKTSGKLYLDFDIVWVFSLAYVGTFTL
jgi:hypothetical protein